MRGIRFSFPAYLVLALSCDSALEAQSPSCIPVAAPILYSPLAGATGQASDVTLRWAAVDGAVRYDLYLDTSRSPDSLLASGLAAASYPVANLASGTSYFWRVVANGDPACDPTPSASSEVWTFTTEGGCYVPRKFSLSTPADGQGGLSGNVLLTWNSEPGTGSYDVFLGTTNPPPLIAFGVSEPRFLAAQLVPGARYYWNVVARAACDETKTMATGLQSFQMAGTCSPPGAFSLQLPADRATGVTGNPVLGWTGSPHAGSFDLHLGKEPEPPLFLTGLTQNFAQVSALDPGATYYWKVIARTSCDDSLLAVSPVFRFQVTPECLVPGTPTIGLVPSGNVGAGQSYVIAWQEAQGLDPLGGYLVERSSDPDFNRILDGQITVRTSASFVAGTPGRIFHRVRAVSGCDPSIMSPDSDPRSITVVPGQPNVVFTLQPEPVITALGEPLEGKSSRFMLENLTKEPIPISVSRAELNSVPFFYLVDPDGGSPALVTLEPGRPKTFQIRYFTGPSADTPGAYQGLVVVTSLGSGLAVTPYAFVSLKVGGAEAAAPQFRFRGVDSEYAFFPGLSGNDANREPITVEIWNPGRDPMELGAEIGPELWLEPEKNWNAAPISPGATREVRLFARRARAPNGSALPRYTYFTVRTRNGQSARLIVQDNDESLLAEGRVPLGRSTGSWIVPSAASATSATGNLFVSRLRLSNSSTDTVQAEIFFTPPGEDGFDRNAVRKAIVVVPPNDAVNLTDPLVQLFAMSRPAVGTLEVRVAKGNEGALSVTSGVDAPSRTGGTFGFQMPVVKRGTGARAGNPYEIAGITATSDFRTNLILTETTGIEATEAKVTLFDRTGQKLGDRTLTVSRYGMSQINGVVSALGGGETQEAASLEIEVLSGGGSVFGVVTVIDNRNDDAVTYLGKPVRQQTPSALSNSVKKPVWARAAATQKAIVPSIVSGYTQALPGAGSPYMFRSLMGFKAPASQAATFRLTYYDLAKDPDNAEKRVRTVEVPKRSTVEYQNVIEELFGVAAGQNSQGPVFVEVTGSGTVYTKVFSTVEGKGSFGDAFPVIPIVSEGLSGGVSMRPLEIDGLEQALVETSPGKWSERVRGTRTNLIINEVLGKAVTIRVRLYEAGNRSVPIAEKELDLKPLERLQLNTVFSALGLNDDTRRKDRPNVKCVVQATRGEGMVSAVVTTIDNQTADTRNGQMVPAGTGAGTGPIGF